MGFYAQRISRTVLQKHKHYLSQGILLKDK
ncbi:Unannotated [Lentimonas sp. CC11]|nr:Unannotated [Lentimonas sp. CC10]CAA7071530.1 Unannotated [Lentimonas sp. CC11]